MPNTKGTDAQIAGAVTAPGMKLPVNKVKATCINHVLLFIDAHDNGMHLLELYTAQGDGTGRDCSFTWVLCTMLLIQNMELVLRHAGPLANAV